MNRRIIALALAPVAIAVIAFAVLGVGDTEARQTPPPAATAAIANQVQTCSADAAPADCGGYPVYECFSIMGSWGEASDPQEEVSLYTSNFGDDDVVVRKLVWLCESGYKYPDEHGAGSVSTDPGVQGGGTRVYACYLVARGDYVYQREEIWTDNFGLDKVLVRNSNVMCERAEKEHNGITTGSLDASADEGADAAGYGSNIWQCFSISALPRLRTFGIWTDNFDWHRIVTWGGVQWCENAVKYHGTYEGGSANGYFRECFRTQMLERYWEPQYVSLYTNNFGWVNAIVGRPNMMCEHAWWNN